MPDIVFLPSRARHIRRHVFHSHARSHALPETNAPCSIGSATTHSRTDGIHSSGRPGTGGARSASAVHNRRDSCRPTTRWRRYGHPDRHLTTSPGARHGPPILRGGNRARGRDKKGSGNVANRGQVVAGCLAGGRLSQWTGWSAIRPGFGKARRSGPSWLSGGLVRLLRGAGSLGRAAAAHFSRRCRRCRLRSTGTTCRRHQRRR